MTSSPLGVRAKGTEGIRNGIIRKIVRRMGTKMFTKDELEVISNFFDIQENKENVLLHMDSKNTKNQWILLDFTEKFEERYGLYFKAPASKVYKPFNQVKALTNVLNLISSFESKEK